MEFETARRDRPQINLSALIDIVFILVIFIVLAANFQRIQGIEVDLPNAAPTDETPAEPVTVTIDAEGTVRVGAQIVAMDDLQAKLQEQRAEKEAIVIRAAATVDFEVAVQTLSAARRAGFEGVSIATEASK